MSHTSHTREEKPCAPMPHLAEALSAVPATAAGLTPALTPAQDYQRTLRAHRAILAQFKRAWRNLDAADRDGFVGDVTLRAIGKLAVEIDSIETALRALGHEPL